MAKFLKFKFLYALKFNFINKYQNLVNSKSGKKSLKIVKLEVENFEHLRCKF